jgi:hypothetical protein
MLPIGSTESWLTPSGQSSGPPVLSVRALCQSVERQRRARQVAHQTLKLIPSARRHRDIRMQAEPLKPGRAPPGRRHGGRRPEAAHRLPGPRSQHRASQLRRCAHAAPGRPGRLGRPDEAAATPPRGKPAVGPTPWRERRRLCRAHLSLERNGQPKAVVAPTGRERFTPRELRGSIAARPGRLSSNLTTS